ncbi:hypothetical protein [Solidesulfovibrio sp.]
MPKVPQPGPPLLPVIPLYKPWLDRVIRETAADASAADAAFAARRGPLTGPAGQPPSPPASVPGNVPASPPEQPRGAIADETA